jgi:hypothetical protein
MSLTSYQAAPPRVFIYVDENSESKLKTYPRLSNFTGMKVAPAVGFEPTTNRLTADRSTTELRWIASARINRCIQLAHRGSRGKSVIG